MNKRTSFWILTITIFIALILPSLLKDGMFMDGLFYACLAKNLSEGIGTFWYPHFSKTCYPFYFHNPPLGIGIQSLFFSVFGTSMYVERFYSFFTAVVALILIAILWKTTFRSEKSIREISWLPVLLWISIPVCFWSYKNNLLENTMAIFDLAAMIFIARFFFRKQNITYLFISGFFIFCAVLTKGFQGMFPFSALFFGWLFLRNISFTKTFLLSVLIPLVVFTLFFLLFQNDDVRNSLTKYLTERVFNSIQNVSNVENRFYIIGRLAFELLVPIILSAIPVVFNKLKKSSYSFNPYLKHAFFFIAIGISASFPLMITREQRSFYLVTSLPYYAIGISIFIAPYILFFTDKISEKIAFVLKIFGIVVFIFVIVLSYFQIGKFHRDEEAMHDIHLIGKIIPRETVLGTTDELWHQWSLQEYFIRHYYICMDTDISEKKDFIFIDSPEKIPADLKAEKVNIPTKKYHLYKILK